MYYYHRHLSAEHTGSRGRLEYACPHILRFEVRRYGSSCSTGYTREDGRGWTRRTGSGAGKRRPAGPGVCRDNTRTGNRPVRNCKDGKGGRCEARWDVTGRQHFQCVASRNTATLRQTGPTGPLSTITSQAGRPPAPLGDLTSLCLQMQRPAQPCPVTSQSSPLTQSIGQSQPVELRVV